MANENLGEKLRRKIQALKVSLLLMFQIYVSSTLVPQNTILP